MRRQLAHGIENGVAVVPGKQQIVDRGRHLERRRTDGSEVGVGVENARQQRGLHHLLELFLAHAGGAENAFEMRIQRRQVQQRLVDVEDNDQ
jgi:phosphopantetheinyl transferase